MSKPRITYTLLSCFKRCRRRCYLEHVKRVVDFDKIDQRPFIVGTVVDYLLKEWILKDYEPEGWMEKKAEDLFIWFSKKRRIVYKNKEDRTKLIRKTRNATRHLESAVYYNQFPTRVIVPQKKVAFIEDGREFYGKMDLFFPKEHLIWDLKITENKKYLDPFQLKFFAWLLEHEGEEIEGLAFLSPLMKKQLFEFPWDTVDRHYFEEELEELLIDFDRGEWDRTAKDCWGCPVFFHCEDSDKVSNFRKSSGASYKFNLGG